MFRERPQVGDLSSEHFQETFRISRMSSRKTRGFGFRTDHRGILCLQGLILAKLDLERKFVSGGTAAECSGRPDAPCAGRLSARTRVPPRPWDTAGPAASAGDSGASRPRCRPTSPVCAAGVCMGPPGDGRGKGGLGAVCMAVADGSEQTCTNLPSRSAPTAPSVTLTQREPRVFSRQSCAQMSRSGARTASAELDLKAVMALGGH